MSDFLDVDVLKSAIVLVKEALGDVWVADHLPHADQLEDSLPAVVLDVLPGEEQQGWGGQSGEQFLDLIPLDVEVLARSRAEATPVAARVRQLLHQLPFIEGTGVKTVDCPRFSTREDINPQIRVLGAVAEVTASPH